jgi:hypothetical protein
VTFHFDARGRTADPAQWAAGFPRRHRAALTGGARRRLGAVVRAQRARDEIDVTNSSTPTATTSTARCGTTTDLFAADGTMEIGRRACTPAGPASGAA